MKSLAVAPLLLFLLSGCTDAVGDSATSTQVAEVADADAPYLRRPITSSPLTEAAPKLPASLIFADSIYDFGRVRQGHTVRHRFTFTNAGGQPVVIQDVRSSCGCTVVDYPPGPVSPGGSGSLTVTLNTARQSGRLHKPVALIIDNQIYPSAVYLTGTVIK